MKVFRRARSSTDDRGAILPLVMVSTVLISAATVAVAKYVSTDLRYSNVVEARADRLAAADGGLRYGIEKLRNFQTLCTTGAGVGGVTTIFPPLINGAVTSVTCQRVGNPISDVQGWGVVVTGEGVPSGVPLFRTLGGGQSTGNIKTFSGPVYVSDPTRIDLDALLEIKDGDLWYSADNCDNEPVIPEVQSGDLLFSPDFFRGVQCIPQEWDEGLFRQPTVEPPPVSPLNAPHVDNATCRVFSPGKYTSMPLGRANYLKAGVYYLENVDLRLQNATLIAGYPDLGADGPKVENPDCAAEQQYDEAINRANGTQGGVTIYLGGSSRINVDNNGRLEIFRRLVGETYLSVFALESSGTGYLASTRDFNTWLLETQSGANNDVAIHGLVWAPRAAASLGNITQAANGQLLGGIAIARLDTQASASATAFTIGIESNPVTTRLLLISTSTLNGRVTRIRAIVEFRPDTGDLAVNSWRVVN